MPVLRGKDSSGYYYQFGENGKKYFYVANNYYSREIARRKAILQGRAEHANKSSITNKAFKI